MAVATAALAGRKCTRRGAQLPAVGLLYASVVLTVFLLAGITSGGANFSMPGDSQGLWRRSSAPAGSGLDSARGGRQLGGGRRLRASLLAGAAALALGAAAHAGLLGGATRARTRSYVQCLRNATPRAAQAMRSMALEVATPCSRLLRGFLAGGSGPSAAASPPAESQVAQRRRVELPETGGTMRRVESEPAMHLRGLTGSPCSRATSTMSLSPVRHVATERPRPKPLTCVEEDAPRLSTASKSSSWVPSSHRPPTPGSSSSSVSSVHTMSAGNVVVPSPSTLYELFGHADVSNSGSLSMDDIALALPLLNTRLNLELDAHDASRLYGFLKGSSSGPVSRNEFVTGLRELAKVLNNLRPRLSTKQLKTVLVAAFARFDANADGSISLNEFVASAKLMGLTLDWEEASCLYRFLCGHDSGMQQAALVGQPPPWEQWTSLLGRSAAQLREKYGWTSVEMLATKVQRAFDGPGDVPEKVSRALHTAWEEVCEVSELATDAAGLALAVKYVSEEVQEQLSTGTIQDVDLLQVAPFAVCIGLFAVNLAKELDELVPKEMTPDEALLYAQHFKQHGFSQAEFRRVLSCPGCHWVTSQPGKVLHNPEDESVKLIVKGHVEVLSPSSPSRRPGVRLGPGASIGGVGFLRGRELWQKEVLRACEEVVHVSWDPEGLRKCVRHDQELSLKMDALLASTFSANLHAVLKYKRPYASVAAKTAGGSGGQELVVGEEEGEVDFDGVLDAMGICQGAVRPTDLEAFLGRVDRDLSVNLGVTRNTCHDLFHWLDKDRDGVVSPTEFRSKMKELERCLQVLDGITMPEILGPFMKGKIDKGDLKHLMGHIDRNLSMGTSDEDCDRLFKHLDADGDGEVSITELTNKLSELSSCLEALHGLTIKEVVTLLHRAFQHFDSNNDGKVSAEEFIAAVQRLKIPLNEEQALMLYSYLDTDKDGAINLGEWCTGSSFPMWLEAVKVALESQVEKKGLARLGYFAEVVHESTKGPGDLVDKGRQLLARLWDGTDVLADATNVLTDGLGVACALSGIWQEVSGINSLAEVDQMDLLPFLVFIGISSVKTMRHLAEGQVSDLSEQEALLYATVFQKWDFSVTEFQRLLSYGDAQWEELAVGDALEVGGEGKEPALRIVARGGCLLQDKAGRRLATVAGGGFLGQLPDFEVGEWLCGRTVQAKEPTTLLKWNLEKLESQLQSDASVKVKVARAATAFMADRLLSAKE